MHRVVSASRLAEEEEKTMCYSITARKTEEGRSRPGQKKNLDSRLSDHKRYSDGQQEEKGDLERRGDSETCFMLSRHFL